MKDTTLGQMWFRRHPALSVIVVLWAMIWGATALSGNDGPGLAIAAWLVLVTPVALIAWGLGALIDRWKQRRQPGAPTQAAAPALLSPVPAAMPTADQLHQRERNELAIEQHEFDGELQHSEAEQWHRLMAQRHAAATRQSGSAMRMVTSAGTTALPLP